MYNIVFQLEAQMLTFTRIVLRIYLSWPIIIMDTNMVIDDITDDIVLQDLFQEVGGPARDSTSTQVHLVYPSQWPTLQ